MPKTNEDKNQDSVRVFRLSLFPVSRMDNQHKECNLTLHYGLLLPRRDTGIMQPGHSHTTHVSTATHVSRDQ